MYIEGNLPETVPSSSLPLFFPSPVLDMEAKTSPTPLKCSTTELHFCPSESIYVQNLMIQVAIVSLRMICLCSLPVFNVFPVFNFLELPCSLGVCLSSYIFSGSHWLLGTCTFVMLITSGNVISLNEIVFQIFALHLWAEEDMCAIFKFYTT